MSYVIEDNIPLPECQNKGMGGSPRGPRKPWTKTLDTLKPGQSTFTTEYSDLNALAQFKLYRPERVYATRKVPGQGWRVWRVA
jgi:hypothetical protein